MGVVGVGVDVGVGAEVRSEKRTKLIEFLDAENLVNENVLPEIWLVGCELHRFVETPMHLPFENKPMSAVCPIGYPNP